MLEFRAELDEKEESISSFTEVLDRTLRDKNWMFHHCLSSLCGKCITIGI